MSSPTTLTVFVGTRPEVIKLVPVVRALRARPAEAVVTVCSTGQHSEMLTQTLEAFDLTPDVRLEVMESGASLASLTARLFSEIGHALESDPVDWVVVQGDTTTAMVAALCGYYRGSKVAHVEAGLRTGDRHRPFPEEVNRSVIARVADIHFAPTHRAATNLEHEGIPPAMLHVVGNTVVDSAKWALAQIGNTVPAGLSRDLVSFIDGRRLLLVTMHRRESLGPDLDAALRAMRTLADDHEDLRVLYPAHLNPQVTGPARALLADHPRIRVVPPLGYLAFLWLLKQSELVLTDSGGIQEEALSVGCPVLVAREATERPELIEAGWGTLVGTDPTAIVEAASKLLAAGPPARSSGLSPNPFGDGLAGERIADLLLRSAGT